jgi:hypothetical protein
VRGVATRELGAYEKDGIRMIFGRGSDSCLVGGQISSNQALASIPSLLE